MSRYDTPGVCPQCGRNNLPPAKQNVMADIVNVIRTRPDLTYKQIAAAFKLDVRTVKRYAQRARIIRRKKQLKTGNSQ